MAQSAPARTKINTKVTQPAPGRPSRRPAGRPGPGRPPRGPRVSGEARDPVRQPDRPVIELDFGILVYPPETGGVPLRAGISAHWRRPDSPERRHTLPSAHSRYRVLGLT